MNLEVHHDEAAKRYYALIDGKEARLDYEEAGDRTLDFQHTFVDQGLRGRGVAQKLIRHALDDARGRGYRVVPTCRAVRQFIARHPEYRDDAARR